MNIACEHAMSEGSSGTLWSMEECFCLSLRWGMVREDSTSKHPAPQIGLRTRYENLGVQDIYMKCAVKITTFEEFLKKYSLSADEVIYVGDDIPDYEVMKRCGCPCCPADACSDIKAISLYISDRKGGYGCGRDIVEQVLKAQGKWLSDAKAFGW